MGTNSLTVVRYKNEYKIAQRGHFDGRPAYQCRVILDFLENSYLETFKKKLDNVYSDGMETSDIGAHILEEVYKGQEHVYDSLYFAESSLFCEWCYVLDLDKMTFEIYKGYNKNPLEPTERFYNRNVTTHKHYYPVKLLLEYKIGNIPDLKTLLDEIYDFK
jgi:hypothetical protein